MMVFFADGPWSIAQGTHSNGYLGKWSGIAHACGWFKKKHYTAPDQIRAQEHPICAKCLDQIPNALVGLWKMHNWDNLQEWEMYQHTLSKIQSTHTFYGHNMFAMPGQVWEFYPSKYAPTFVPQ